MTLEQKLNATDGETVNPVIEGFKSFAAVEDLTATLTGELLERITLYAGEKTGCYGGVPQEVIY